MVINLIKSGTKKVLTSLSELKGEINSNDNYKVTVFDLTQGSLVSANILSGKEVEQFLIQYESNSNVLVKISVYRPKMAAAHMHLQIGKEQIEVTEEQAVKIANFLKIMDVNIKNGIIPEEYREAVMHIISETPSSDEDSDNVDSVVEKIANAVAEKIITILSPLFSTKQKKTQEADNVGSDTTNETINEVLTVLNEIQHQKKSQEQPQKQTSNKNKSQSTVKKVVEKKQKKTNKKDKKTTTNAPKKTQPQKPKKEVLTTNTTANEVFDTIYDKLPNQAGLASFLARVVVYYNPDAELKVIRKRFKNILERYRADYVVAGEKIITYLSNKGYNTPPIHEAINYYTERRSK